MGMVGRRSSSAVAGVLLCTCCLVAISTVMQEVTLDLFNRCFDDAEASCRETMQEVARAKLVLTEMKTQLSHIERQVEQLHIHAGGLTAEPGR